MADYRRNPVRVQGWLASLLGILVVGSLEVYFLGLEQRWRFKNKV
jgi:hypothetical protein